MSSRAHEVGKNPELGQPLTNDVEAQAQAGASSSQTPRAEQYNLLRQISLGVNSAGDEDQRDETLTMEWKGVSFKIGEKQILKNISGLVQRGKLTGVLGPSGSGKSTLLNVLAGRQRTNAVGMSFSGEITASGSPVDPVDFRSNIAYVMQDDSLMATETPRECLEFSAHLRLPRAITREQRETLVEQLLNTLGLQKCSNTIVGNALIKGISGGERKRTAVGMELITNPKLLFLDEPLSGLDSYAAFTLVEALQDLASAGIPVLCTVHQPSSEIFQKFDDVIFLHDGEVAYHGPVQDVSAHFARLGYPCAANFNPADHVMFMLQKEPPEQISMVKEKWLTSDAYGRLVACVDESRKDAEPSGLRRGRASRGPSALRQLVLLTRRECRAIFRNKGILGARVGMAIFLGVLYAWLFAGSAKTGDATLGEDQTNCVTATFDPSSCSTDFQAHYGCMISLCIMAMMGSAQPIILSFPSERPVFLREYAARMYGVAPYFVSKTLMEMPVVLAVQVVTFLIAYWIMGLHGNFALLVLWSFCLGIASSSLALLIGCSVASAQKVIQLAPLALIPQMLFSGLFLPVQKIPPSLQWVQYLCPLKYAINLMTIQEFHYIHDTIEECQKDHTEFECQASYPGYYLRDALITKQSVKWDDLGKDLAILLALYAGFRIIAALLLWRKGRYVY